MFHAVNTQYTHRAPDDVALRMDNEKEALPKKSTPLRPKTLPEGDVLELMSGDLFHFHDVSRQVILDGVRTKPSFLGRICSRVLGYTTMRRISNFFACFRLPNFFDAHRDYAVLPENCIIKNSQGLQLKLNGQKQTASTLAHAYKPNLSTISGVQFVEQQNQALEIRYEVLPPKDNKSCYTIIYYIGRSTETLLIPMASKLYDWLRVVLYGSQKDWEPIQVEINRDTGLAEGLLYETTNYTADPSSYDLISTRHLHLKTKVEKQEDGRWLHTVYQKNNKSRTREVENPFVNQQPNLAFVSWNGLFDLEEMVKKQGYQSESEDKIRKIYKLNDASLLFLDIHTFCEQGFDLRAPWLKVRKKHRSVMWTEPRESHTEKRRMALIGSRMPRLMPQS